MIDRPDPDLEQGGRLGLVEPARPGQPWLYGPVSDLSFGCGALFAATSLVLGFGNRAVLQSIPAVLALLLSVESLEERFSVLPSVLNEGRLAAAARSLDRQAWFGTIDAIARFQLVGATGQRAISRTRRARSRGHCRVGGCDDGAGRCRGSRGRVHADRARHSRAPCDR